MILNFLKPYRIPLYIALFFMLAELVVELIHPLLLAKIIDEGIANNRLDTVLIWGALMVGSSLIAFVSGVLNSFFAGHVSQATGFDIRNTLYSKIQSFSFASSQRFPTSSLITRLTNDVTQIQNTIFMGLRIMMRAPLIVIGGVIMALLINVQLGLFLVITIPILILFLMVMMKKGGALFKQVQQKLDGVNSIIREHLGGIKLIKAYVRRKHENKRFVQQNKQLMEHTVKALRLMEITMPILLFLMNITIIAILWFGRELLLTGSIQVGEIVAIINYILRITGALTVFSMIIMVFSRSKASAERIAEVLHNKEDLTEPLQVENPLLNPKETVLFEDVSFRYPNSTKWSLQHLNLSIQKGETVAIIGGTGSGKTSLFQLIPRLYDATEGSVKINGIEVKKQSIEALRTSIAYVPQDVMLFTGTIKSNISWGKNDALDEEIMNAAKSAQIHSTIEKLPQQYEERIGQKGVNLSGGQKQRISIARALIRQPDILLLDDCTSALDGETESHLMTALKKYDCTTLIITQKVSSASQCDRIILLENGKVHANGTHEELLANNELYRKIEESQRRGGVLSNA
ncbi:ABC transporter ATP-binding protein [Alkalihalobacillus trypoxylicola]|uniref:ABC transporter ATP-binding protein n=1 Tax=Alkalihalobacillus trypoxylicola TaxID=519424 RepID=A0A161P561_9BACI|nr:ABC transporter ATP-binding protein [Alkalihalobacillus trypoxylicola]KYG27085.1 ABC transporter ATP-binding protein [Alkalihalobacillus trypoxylicola]